MNTAPPPPPPTTTMQMDPSGEELAGRRGDGQHPTMRQSLRFLVRIASLFVRLVRAQLGIIIITTTIAIPTSNTTTQSGYDLLLKQPEILATTILDDAR